LHVALQSKGRNPRFPLAFRAFGRRKETSTKKHRKKQRGGMEHESHARTSIGGPDQLRLEDAPEPQPQANQVQIRVRAAGINPQIWFVYPDASVTCHCHTLPEPT
jgi:hypothetical protein